MNSMFRSVVVPFLLSAEPIGEAIPIQDGSDDEDLRLESKIRSSVAAVRQKSRIGQQRQNMNVDILGFSPGISKGTSPCPSRRERSFARSSSVCCGDKHDEWRHATGDASRGMSAMWHEPRRTEQHSNLEVVTGGHKPRSMLTAHGRNAHSTPSPPPMEGWSGDDQGYDEEDSPEDNPYFAESLTAAIAKRNRFAGPTRRHFEDDVMAQGSSHDYPENTLGRTIQRAATAADYRRGSPCKASAVSVFARQHVKSLNDVQDSKFPVDVRITDQDFIETNAPLPATRIIDQLTLWRKLMSKTLLQINVCVGIPQGFSSEADLRHAYPEPSFGSCSMITTSSCHEKIKGPDRREVCALAGQLSLLYIARKMLKDLAFKEKNSCLWRLFNLTMQDTLKRIPKALSEQKMRDEKCVEKAEEKLQLRVGSWETLRTLLKNRTLFPEMDCAKAKDEMVYTSWKIICLASFCLERSWASLSDIPEQETELDSADGPLRLPENSRQVLGAAFQMMKPFAKRSEVREIESIEESLLVSEDESEPITCAFLDESVGDLVKMLDIYDDIVAHVLRSIRTQERPRSSKAKKRAQSGYRLIGNIYLLMQKTCQRIHDSCLPPAVVPADSRVMRDEVRLFTYIKELRRAKATIRRDMQGEPRGVLLTMPKYVRANNLLLWLLSFLSVHLMDLFQEEMRAGKPPKLPSTRSPDGSEEHYYPSKPIGVSLDTLKILAGKHFDEEEPLLKAISAYRDELRSTSVSPQQSDNEAGDGPSVRPSEGVLRQNPRHRRQQQRGLSMGPTAAAMAEKKSTKNEKRSADNAAERLERVLRGF